MPLCLIMSLSLPLWLAGAGASHKFLNASKVELGKSRYPGIVPHAIPSATINMVNFTKDYHLAYEHHHTSSHSSANGDLIEPSILVGAGHWLIFYFVLFCKMLTNCNILFTPLSFQPSLENHSIVLCNIPCHKSVSLGGTAFVQGKSHINLSLTNSLAQSYAHFLSD